MNNSMNILKRMMAFLLAMLLLTTMVGDDFFSLADSDLDVVTEAVEDGDIVAEPETTEGEYQDTSVPEPEVVTEEIEEPDVTEDVIPEEPVIEEATDEPSVDDFDVDNSQNIDETEELTEEETEEELDEVEEEEPEDEECDHEWKYISNNDGTHTKRCTKCDEEETEDCQFDENWVCEKCGYEDMSLEYQEYSKTIHGVKVTVSGDMPRNSKITVYTKSLTRMSEIVNENIDEEGTFEAYEAFDINIYDRHGDKYQPKDDGNTVSVTFEGVSELADTPDEEIVAYRIEDDQSTVTEIPTDVSGEDVTFDAEHFSIYVVGTVNSNLYASYQSYQNFATILTASTTKAYTRVKKVRFDMYVDSIEEFNFTATVYKDLNSTTNPTSGTPVATKTDKETPTSTGWMTVELTLPTSSSGYIQAGEKFSIVVSSTNDLVNIGYGTQKDSTYSAPTYVKGTSSWSRRGAEDEIFYIIEGDTIELTDVTEDTYTIDSITASTGKADNQKIYHYAVGDTDTLSAIIKDVDGNTVSRTVSWTSENEGVVKVDSSGKLTAVGTGTTTVTATYTNSSSTPSKLPITVNVIAITMADGPYTYTGQKIEPAVTVSGGDSSATVSTNYENNEDASTSTSKAKAITTYTINGKAYTFTNEFTISPAALTVDAFANAKLEVVDGEVSNITGANLSGQALTYNKDFTATTSTPTSTSSGVVYEVEITGQGNYTGSFTWEKTIADVDVKSVIKTVKLTTAGINLSNISYDGTEKKLTLDNKNWIEVQFIDYDNQVRKDIINNETATYIITDKGGTEKSATTAGNKTLTFEMNSTSGYAGSKISVDFVIQKANMSSATIKWNHNNVADNRTFDHTGEPIEPKAGVDFDVYIGGEKVDSTVNADGTGVEYNVSYPYAHTDVGTATLRITASGNNFTSYKDDTYEIVPCYKNDIYVRITDGINYETTPGKSGSTGYSTYYDPTQKSKYFASSDPNHEDNVNWPNLQVILPGASSFVEGTDYEVAIYNDADCRYAFTNDVSEYGTTKYIKVTGKGTYATQDPIIASFTVNKMPISDVTITPKSGITKTFNGKEINLTAATASSTTNADITVKYGSTILTLGTDYDIKYENNVNAGTATYKIVGLKNYTGEAVNPSKYKFTINKASIAAGNSDGVTVGLVTEQTFKYDGKVKKPAVKVVITTNGTTTFEESIDPTTNTTLSTDNFTVSYENDPSPGKHLITLSATSTGNLKDSVTIPITIGSNTSSFDIWVTGDNGQNQAQRLSTLDKTTEETAEDGSTYTVYTRYYYLDNNFKTYYTGKKVACGFSVYDSEGTLLEKGSDYSSFYSGTAIKAYVQSGDYTASTSSPYLSITGLGNYENNVAIVYFNIQPRNIDEVTVTGIADNYPWEQGVAKTPPTAPVLTFNGNTLTEGENNDYTVKYYDTYDPEDSTKNVEITAKAGTKYAVFTAKSGGNYTGTKVVTYTVGTSLEKLKVSISSATNDNTTADDGTLVNNLIWVNQEDVSAKTYNIDWMYGGVDSEGKSYGAAPIITLFDSTGTAIDSSKYSVTESSSKYGTDKTNNKFYNSREGDDTEYNVITYTATPKYEEGYFGEPVVITYRINPQPFTGGRVMQDAEALNDKQPYTGADITVNPAYVFTYKYKLKDTPLSTFENGHSCKLVAGTDFKPASLEIGKNVGDNKSVTVQGTGNFIGDRNIPISIVQGDVKVWAVYNGETHEITSQLTADDTTTETNDYIVDLGGIYSYEEGKNQCPEIYVTPTALEGEDNALGTADCVIAYPADQTSADGNDKLIVVDVNKNGVASSNFKTKKITVKYKIKTNDISGFYGQLEDVTYDATTLDVTKIDTLLKSGLKLKVATSENGKELVRGTDYEVKSVDTTSYPSYQTNTLTVEGKGTYSGTLAIKFNIVLDINDTAYAKVSAQQASYELDDKGITTVKVLPIVIFRDLGPNGSFDKNLKDMPLGIAYEECFTVSRTRDKQPGPDSTLAFTGKNVCTGTKSNVRYNDGTNDGTIVTFKASLSNYTAADFVLPNEGVYDYTGSNINVTLSGKPLNGATVAANKEALAGDYYLEIKDKDGVPQTGEIKKAGKYTIVVYATDNSGYFIKESSTISNPITFYIKYNLADTHVRMTFYNDQGVEITSVPYTGSAYSFADHVGIYYVIGGNRDAIIYHFNGSGSAHDYIKFKPESFKTVSNNLEVIAYADPKPNDYCYGEASSTFTVNGIDINDCTIYYDNNTWEADSVPEYSYTGSAKKPSIKITHATNGTLKEGTDYTVTFDDDISNVGEKTVTIKGIGAYSSAATRKYKITPVAITEGMITVAQPAYYAGRNVDVKPEVTVKTSTDTLQEGVDYTLEWPADHSNSGVRDDAYVTVKKGTGGNYTLANPNGITKTFKISKLDLRSVAGNIVIKPKDPITEEFKSDFTDAEQDPYSYLEVYLGDVKLYSPKDDGENESTCDYTIKVYNTSNKETPLKAVGKYKLRIYGANNCDDRYYIEQDFEITARSLSNIYHYYYDAEAAKFVPKDWDSSYNPTLQRYETEDASGKGLKITIEDVTTVQTTGGANANKPIISIVDMGITDTAGNYKTLEEGEDYEVTLARNKTTGSAAWTKSGSKKQNASVASTSPEITITGKGMYKDSISLPYNIGKNLNTLDLNVTYRYEGDTYTYSTAENKPEKYKDQWAHEYDGKTHQPVVVSVGNIGAKNYSVTYTDLNDNEKPRVDAGYYKVVITGQGDYCGTITQVFKINKKAIGNASNTLFETQDPMHPMQSDDGMLKFTVSGTNISRMTADDVQTYLVDTGKIKAEDTANQNKFVNYYYAVYDGTTVKPTIKIEDTQLNTVIDNSKDVTITYEPDCNQASTFKYEGNSLLYETSTINIQFKSNTEDNEGNYYAPSTPITFTIKFIIIEESLSDFDVKFVNGTDDNRVDYADGAEITPQVTVFRPSTSTDVKNELDLGTDYTLKYDDNVIPGKATVTVTGIGNYSGKKILNFYITGDLSKTSVYYEDASGNLVRSGDDQGPTQKYHGEGITEGDPKMYLVLEHPGVNPEKEKLELNKQYTCLKPATGTKTGEVVYRGVTDKSKDYYWTGEKTVTFNIDFDVSNIGILNYQPEYPYTGKPIIPDFKLDYSESVASITSIEYKRDGKTITYTGDGDTVEEAPDFVEPGTIEATINYDVNGEPGTKTVTYDITPRSLDKCKVIYTQNNRYTGQQVKPGFTVFIIEDGKVVQTLEKDKHYTVEYGANIYGDATITITGNGNELVGSKTYYATISLGKPVNLKLSASGQSITATWVHDIYTAGDELELVKVDTGEVLSVKKVKSSTQTYTFTGLENVTNYKVRIRSYQTINGDLKYSDYTEDMTTTDISSSSLSYKTSNGKVTIIWGDDFGDAVIYKVYRATNATDKGTKIAVYPTSTGAYTNSNLVPGTTYYYYVEGYSIINGKLTLVSESEHIQVTVK
ncbi:Ig-like domain-containing protein [Pseudobutyrivibrio ruminis]|uniref:Ig-like domain (Group 2) n=1 Tax=Pseudobutyrivibrio ruminis DSM 9787 TaxID=1123011 RepID=A0A285T798_9FIRM|nr:Ig-like domain-containing protein [Pseudobutyrivibrio ruminis]SOC17128.1 Ig-like domain (group 2) [Pseudobutyrivibrio ruminis DSM 9787]